MIQHKAKKTRFKGHGRNNVGLDVYSSMASQRANLMGKQGMDCTEAVAIRVRVRGERIKIGILPLNQT